MSTCRVCGDEVITTHEDPLCWDCLSLTDCDDYDPAGCGDAEEDEDA